MNLRLRNKYENIQTKKSSPEVKQQIADELMELDIKAMKRDDMIRFIKMRLASNLEN